MTTEQKIIAIAEFEGWKELRDGRWKFAETGIVERFLPLYLTSRDAICVAVEKLDEDQFEMWIDHLKDIIHCGSWEIDCLTIEEKKNLFLATPAQMADALLLTLGHEI